MTNISVPISATLPMTVSHSEQERVMRFKDEVIAVFTRGNFAEARQIAAKGLIYFTEKNERSGQAMALYQLGCVYRSQGDFSASKDIFQQSIDMYQSLGDIRGQAMAINGMGLTFKYASDHSSSLNCFQRSLVLAKEVNDPFIETSALGNISTIYLHIGDNATSLEMLHRCLVLFEEMNDEHKIAVALHNIAINYMVLKDHKAAIPFLERGIAIQEKLGDRYHFASMVDVLGAAHIRLQQFETGLAYLHRGLEIFEALEMPGLMAMSLSRIGETLVEMRRLEEAKSVMERSLAINGKDGNKTHYTENLARLGSLYADHEFAEHNYTRAIQLLNEARLVGEELDLVSACCSIYSQLADLYERQGDLKQALAFHRLMYQMEKRLFNEQSDERVKNLQVRFEVSQAQQTAAIARRDAEIAHLRTVELAEALTEAERLRVIADQRAVTDGLTGVLNRRYLDEKLTEEWERSLRYNHPLTLALMDIDHFKKINDRFGHDIGDETLRRVASLLQSECLSSRSIVARYGGEEFVLILPETSTVTACALCERIRASIEATNWEDIAVGLQVTISIGIGSSCCETSEPPTQPAMLVKMADQKLYASKAEGRNRVSW